MIVTLNFSEATYRETPSVAQSADISVDEMISAGFAEHLVTRCSLGRRDAASSVLGLQTEHEQEQ